MFVFFKQKTAYDMRISDWSSDVCSSDLAPRGKVARRLVERELRDRRRQPRHQIPRRLVMRAARTDDEARPARRRRSAAIGSRVPGGEIGRASCRERMFHHGKIPVVAVQLNKNKNTELKHTTRTNK